MRSIDGYLSRRAQAAFPAATVSYTVVDGERCAWQLDRPDVAPVGLGDNFHEAKQAVDALVTAAKA